MFAIHKEIYEIQLYFNKSFIYWHTPSLKRDNDMGTNTFSTMLLSFWHYHIKMDIAISGNLKNGCGLVIKQDQLKLQFWNYAHGTCSMYHGPLARYVKLRVAHAPGMVGTFSPPPMVSNTDKHHGTCVTHVPWCMLGSLISGLLWSRWRRKRSRHSRRMRNPQFYVAGKRPEM